MARKASPVRKAVKKPTRVKNARNGRPRPVADIAKQIKIQKALYEIADAASAVTDMQSFYERLHEIAGTLMYAENFFIALHDPQTDLITWPYYVDTVDIEQPEPILLKEQHGGTGWILRTGRTLSHAEGTVSYAIEHGEAEQTGTVSDAIGVPLKSDGKTVGVLLIQSYRDEIKYNLQHVEIMNFVAQHISIALTRARAIEETRQRNSELAIINSVQAALAAELDIHGIYDAVGQKLREIFSYQDVTIYTCDLMSRIVTVEYSYELGEKSERRSVPMNSLYEYFMTSNRTFVFNGDLPSLAAKFSDYQNPEPPKSLLAVPVRRNKDTDPIVYLTLQDWEGKKFFSDSDVRLMETLANSMSVALENARLFDEVQKRNQEITEALEQQTATSEILSVIASSPTDVQPVFEAIVESAVKLCGGFAGFGYRVLDGKIHLVAQYNDFKRYQELQPDFPLPLDTLESESNVASVIRTCTMLHIEDQKTDPRIIPENRDYAIRVGVGSSIWIPLVKDDKGIGAIVTGKHQVEPFTESQIALIKTFADQAVIAIENVRLFTETQRLLKETEQRAAELQIINAVQEGLASKLDMQGIYDLVGDKIMEIFEADVVGIGFYDRALKALNHPYIVDHGKRYSPPPMPIPDDMVDYLKTHDMTLINTYQEAQNLMERFGIRNIGGPTPDNSFIVVPLMIGGEFMGRITVAKLPAFAFNQSDVRLLQTLVNSMSVALENARLWEQEKIYRKALERELEIGREIQAGFLPEMLPVIEGWEIAASLMSAREVAGDFYDAFELPEGNIGLVIADVCDKGVGAALFMTLFRSLIRAAANLDHFEHTEGENVFHSTAERLQRAISLTNNYIAETHGESGMFATLFFGILDPRDGKFTYINCGHESPFIIHAGAALEPLRVTGPAVGVLANACFEILETQFHAGETFFAFTDGVPDCCNPQGEFYGHERLHDVLLHAGGSSHELVKAIETDLHQYIDGATQFDDITLLAVRWV